MTELLSLSATATLVHDYSMADVDRAARIAVRKHTHSNGLLDDDEREALAWHGVVEELYSCGCGWGTCARTLPLTFRDLLHAGWGALDKEVNDQLRHHGRRGSQNGHTTPRFSQYWGTAPANPHVVLPSRKPSQNTNDGFSEHLCEKLSLRHALGELKPEHYEAIATLAAFDSKAVDAADALGMNYQSFLYRVQAARKTFVAAWFEPEDMPATASKNGGDTCRRGHPRATHGRQKPDGSHECMTCKRLMETRRRHKNKGTAAPTAEAS